ncbi:MAG: alpha/beta fold hydrolase [Sulfitobacter sp.]
MIWLLLGIAALAGATYALSQRREHAARAHPPQGRILAINDVPVHVWTQGVGPDLVLLHGASGNLRDFTFAFAERLSNRYRVIAFDRPGLGWSGLPPQWDQSWQSAGISPAQQAAILQQAGDAIGVKNPIVLGHSYGGAVALAWALNRPQDTAALVLVGAASNPWPGSLGWFYRLCGTRLGGALLIPLLSAFVPQRMVDDSLAAIFEPDAVPQGYAAHIGPNITLRRRVLRANARQVNGLRPHVVAMARKYGRLTMPAELIHGEADTIVPLSVHSEPLLAQLPGARLTALPGTGHMPHHTDPDAVEAAIDRAATRAGLR